MVRASVKSSQKGSGFKTEEGYQATLLRTTFFSKILEVEPSN